MVRGGHLFKKRIHLIHHGNKWNKLVHLPFKCRTLSKWHDDTVTGIHQPVTNVSVMDLRSGASMLIGLRQANRLNTLLEIKRHDVLHALVCINPRAAKILHPEASIEINETITIISMLHTKVLAA